MIRVRVRGRQGHVALCINQLERKQLCGLCQGGDVGPWLGFVCGSCGAVVLSVECDSAEEAAETERWMYECMEKLITRNLQQMAMESLQRQGVAPMQAEGVAPAAPRALPPPPKQEPRWMSPEEWQDRQRQGQQAQLKLDELFSRFNAEKRKA